jgi:N-acetylmuramoyl-L-alanine amidase
MLLMLAFVGTLGLAALSARSLARPDQANLQPTATLVFPVSGGLNAHPIATTAPPLNVTVPSNQDQAQPNALPPGPLVGIVAGHWGNDSGSVCPDGVTEQQVNLEIAKRVVELLRRHGYWVDLLQEFDGRLQGYRANVLVSIHADSCEPIEAEPPATGFKVARSAASAIPTTEDKLVNCIKNEYAKVTGLPFHANSITIDMTSYHSFGEINPDTPAAIIETGFLHLDYNMLVNQPELPAQGIANGIICFIDSQP